MPELPPLRDVIARAGLLADKRLGQHFLLDLNLTGRIARSVANLSHGTTIEIGPGPGGLTRALLEAGATVVTVEKDPRCRAILAEIAEAYPGRLTSLEGDALSVDAGALGTAPRRIVSNLPYNVGTELLIRWLENATAFESFTLMFQTEVAMRLTAPADTGAYGRLSVLAQWLCDVNPLFHINPKAFTPPPLVQSTVVQLVPRKEPLAPARRETLERVTAAAFGQRRKMLRQSLMAVAAGTALADGERLCRAAGVEPTARAETLSVRQFCAIANALDMAKG
ncbi:MAG: 16S rRNA (adenine(1518)-N(6)/adenine(1519)-N(6))-dimethyltransferase RsmA [Rhodospirillaceae bacterium]|nr:16S rRNA (adenine(1518)-N(6)/adenine(1519)-N(6))-dimethyltransferase RsmA [Rhodospirillaceae bacterium]